MDLSKLQKITLGNGQTVYVDNQGKFYDTNGNSVSNQTVGSSVTAPASNTNTGANPGPSSGTSDWGEDYNKVGDTPTSFYGQTTRDTDEEKRTLNELQGFSNVMGSTGIINPSFISTLFSDPSIVAFYANAVNTKYGGYLVGDILNDMKRREMIDNGGKDPNTGKTFNVDSLKNLKIIDPEKDRSTYQQTAEGQKSVTDTSSVIPTFNFQGLLNPEILNYGSNMPEDIFKILVPIADPNSQVFKDAVATARAKLFDIASTDLQSTTDQEKAVADYNYKQWKTETEKQLGITLSDNASEAWKQINDIENSMNTRGLQGSGIESQAMDEYLKSVRKTDQRNRDKTLTAEETQKANYYRSSATATEIAALTPEQRTDWGLTPTADQIKAYSVETLKSQFPDWTDEMIQAKHNSIIDENGNYRSTLYKNYYGGLSTNVSNLTSTAIGQVKAKAQTDEEKAYRPYDYSTNNPLNIAPQSISIQPVDSGTKKASDVAGNISDTLSTNKQTNSQGSPQISGLSTTDQSAVNNAYNQGMGITKPPVTSSVQSPASSVTGNAIGSLPTSSTTSKPTYDELVNKASGGKGWAYLTQGQKDQISSQLQSK